MSEESLKLLTKILDEEISMFKQLLKYEKLKNESIISQDVETIQKISLNEEKFLDEIEKIEKKREKVLFQLFDELKISSKKILSDLIQKLPDDKNDIKLILKKQKKELVESIKNLKKINSINNKLLVDSIKFFNFAISSLQVKESTSLYTADGGEREKYESNLLINHTA